MSNKTTTKQNITVDETTIRQFKSMLVVLIELMPEYAEQKIEEKKRKRGDSYTALVSEISVKCGKM